MNLRKAAREVVDKINAVGGFSHGISPGTVQEIADALRTALASPDPDRWAEGAEAMREEAAALVAAGGYEDTALRVLALPLPSAPTQAPEAVPHRCDPCECDPV